jgi:RNA polymerase sigma-70 factor (ECF subfamily)
MMETTLPHAVAMSGYPTQAPRVPVDLGRLFRDNYDRVWRVMRGLGVAPVRLEDAVQQVFLIYSERQRDVVAGSERAFLFGTALRVARVAWRSGHREVPTDLSVVTCERPGLDELTDQKRARDMLDLMLEQMEPEVRSVFILYEIEGFTTPQIAQIEEIPLGTAASRLRRGREKFAALVERATATRAAVGKKGL